MTTIHLVRLSSLYLKAVSNYSYYKSFPIEEQPITGDTNANTTIIISSFWGDVESLFTTVKD